MRVKSFRNAKIDDLKDSLDKMDLSCYKNIVIHIGGHDIDTNINTSTFREKYCSLLDYVAQKDLKVHVSGLLPRGQRNVKQFNDIIRNICENKDITFIDNHDSFVLASGAQPIEFFYPDEVNLKFPGTRALVWNINRHCTVLPRRNQTPTTARQHHKPGRFRGRFPNQSRYKNRRGPYQHK